MTLLIGDYIDIGRVVLRCPLCQDIVGEIHSSEVLPLIYFLTLSGGPMLCFDCEDLGEADEVPEALKRKQDEVIRIGNKIITFDETWQIDKVQRAACPVNHISKNGPS